MNSDQLNIGIAQISPVWLNKAATIKKASEYIEEAAKSKCDLLVFGEAFIPGYPFWVELTDGARFESEIQKDMFSYYSAQSVDLNKNDLHVLQQSCRNNQIHCVIGTIEKANDRGGHSLYCTLVYIDQTGAIRNTHRKLVPTYEERLVWSPGDGHGLNTFPIGNFQMGALNCWENWMPLSRSALHALGEDLHIAIWPGNARNTENITQYIAKEARSYVISVSSTLLKNQIPSDLPHSRIIKDNAEEILANGGSCIAGPDGNWVIEPVVNEEKLIIATIDHSAVRRERQNFDISGHYSRPDVFQLSVNTERQKLLKRDN